MSNQLKAIGIVRKIDNLGRIVLPIETRRILGWDIGTDIEIFVDGAGHVVLGQYTPGCIHCGDMDKKCVDMDGKKVCYDCAKKIVAKFKA